MENATIFYLINLIVQSVAFRISVTRFILFTKQLQGQNHYVHLKILMALYLFFPQFSSKIAKNTLKER